MPSYTLAIHFVHGLGNIWDFFFSEFYRHNKTTANTKAKRIGAINIQADKSNTSLNIYYYKMEVIMPSE